MGSNKIETKNDATGGRHDSGRRRRKIEALHGLMWWRADDAWNDELWGGKRRGLEKNCSSGNRKRNKLTLA